MKKKSLLTLVAAALLLNSCGGASSTSSSSATSSPSSTTSGSPSSSQASSHDVPGLIRKDVTFKMATHFGPDGAEGEMDENAYYSDYWFLDDSYVRNKELALMSAQACGAASITKLDATGINVAALLSQIGYEGIAKNAYWERDIHLDDSFGVAIGRKTIKDYEGKEYTLLAVLPRTQGYKNEWKGNFELGEEGIHKGFLLARDEMLRFTKKYIADNAIKGDLKIWVAGYSRGAAISNLYGGFLGEKTNYFGEGVHIDPKNVFVYNIATPSTVPTPIDKAEALSVSGPRGEDYSDTDVAAYAYSGEAGVINPLDVKFGFIHNDIAAGDYVTKLPPKKWGFTRYGVTREVVYGGDDFKTYLSEYSEEVANTFADGKNYKTPSPINDFDFQKLNLVPTGESISPDALIEERMDALMSLAASRKEFVAEGYADVLGAAAAVFGVDWEGFFEAESSNVSGLIKAAVFTYLSYAAEEFGLTEAKAISNILAGILGKTKEEAKDYTDQQFLADLFNFLINDYQEDFAGRLRCLLIASLIPAPYGELYQAVLDYASEKKIKLVTFDDLLNLLACYVTDKKDEPAIVNLIATLAGLIPEEYASYLVAFKNLTGKTYEEYPDAASKFKAAIPDILAAAAYGTHFEEGDNYQATEVRYTLLSLVGALLGSNALWSLALNGATSSSGTKTVNDPAPLENLVEELLAKFMPKDEETGERKTFANLADEALVKALEKGRSEKNGAYIDILEANLGKVREMVVTILFNPGEEYDLHHDIAKALSFIETMQVVYPSHYHELYISNLKAEVKPLDK